MVALGAGGRTWVSVPTYHRTVPITPAHAVVAIPLRRLGLPVAALAVGSMVPDVAVFLPQVFDYELTHSPLGVVTVDLAVGLLLLLGWWHWFREPTLDLLPQTLRERVAVHSGLAPSVPWFWGRVVGALVLGAATHVLWDSFTHDGAETARWWPALEGDWGPWPGYQWLQVLSGALGLLLVAGWWWLSWRRAERVVRSRPMVAPRSGWLVLAATTVAGSAVAALLLTQREDVWWVTVLRVLLRGSVLGGVVGLTVVTVGWHRLARRTAARGSSGQSATSEPEATGRHPSR